MKQLIYIGLALCLPAMYCCHALSGKTAEHFPEDVVWISSSMFCPPPGLPASYTPQGDFGSLVIPLKRAGNLILLEAMVDSLSGNLILDTGAAGMVLNGIYFRTSSFTAGRTAGGVTGVVEGISKSKIESLRISDMYYENVHVDVSDLGHIENARNIKILGLFGLNMLSGLEVVIDLAGGVMELHRLDKDGNRLNTGADCPPFDLSIPVRYSNNILFMEGHISGKKLAFCLDSGAESNVLDSHLPDKVLNTVSIHRRSNLRGVGFAAVEVLYGTMNDFSLGDQSLPGMQTIITNLSVIETAYGMQIDGMLGCDFLDKGKFFINSAKKELGICFNKENKK